MSISIRRSISDSIPINAVMHMIYPNLWRDSDQPYSVKCPFHGDTKPSLRVDTVHNRLKCYGACARSYDGVGAVMAAIECSEYDAIQMLTGAFRLDVTILERATVLASLHPHYDNPMTYFHDSESGTPEVYSYLTGRGILPSLISFYDIRLHEQTHLVIPHTESGFIRAVSIRSLDGSEPRYQSIVGALGDIPFGYNQLSDGSPAFLCEGDIDKLSVESLGLPAVSVRINSLTPAIIVRLNAIPLIITIFDGDRTGREATARMIDGLSTLVVPVYLPDGHDCNSLLKSGDLISIILESSVLDSPCDCWTNMTRVKR